jgi:hypothetical protein
MCDTTHYPLHKTKDQGARQCPQERALKPKKLGPGDWARDAQSSRLAKTVRRRDAHPQPAVSRAPACLQTSEWSWIDSSAHNPLIYIEVTGTPSGLQLATGGKGRGENVQTESKTCRLMAEMTLSAVRKNPQEPA